MLIYKYLRFSLYAMLFAIPVVEIFQFRARELVDTLSRAILGTLCFPISQVSYPMMGSDYMIASEIVRMCMTFANDVILLALLLVIPFYNKRCFENSMFYHIYANYWLLAALLSTALVILQIETPPRPDTMDEDLRRISWHALYYLGVMLLLAVGPADYQHYRLYLNPFARLMAYVLLGILGVVVLLIAVGFGMSFLAMLRGL